MSTTFLSWLIREVQSLGNKLLQDALELGLLTPPFGLDIVAELAFLASRKRFVRHLHTASFTDTIFLVATNSEVPPTKYLG